VPTRLVNIAKVVLSWTQALIFHRNDLVFVEEISSFDDNSKLEGGKLESANSTSSQNSKLLLQQLKSVLIFLQDDVQLRHTVF
jgi:hypothetical protein